MPLAFCRHIVSPILAACNVELVLLEIFSHRGQVCVNIWGSILQVQICFSMSVSKPYRGLRLCGLDLPGKSGQVPFCRFERGPALCHMEFPARLLSPWLSGSRFSSYVCFFPAIASEHAAAAVYTLNAEGRGAFQKSPRDRILILHSDSATRPA